jgi:hypothetical protein
MIPIVMYHLGAATQAANARAVIASPMVMTPDDQPVTAATHGRAIVYAAWHGYDPAARLPMTPLRWWATTARHDALAAFPVIEPA